MNTVRSKPYGPVAEEKRRPPGARCPTCGELYVNYVTGIVCMCALWRKVFGRKI